MARNGVNKKTEQVQSGLHTGRGTRTGGVKEGDRFRPFGRGTRVYRVVRVNKSHVVVVLEGGDGERIGIPASSVDNIFEENICK